MLTDVTARILPSGNLWLSTDSAEDAEDLQYQLKQNGQMVALSDALESYFTNGSFEPFDAGLGNPFVGLTDAPCIAEEMVHHDDGTQEIVGRFWYFSNYMLECPIESLIENGFVVFDLAQ